MDTKLKIMNTETKAYKVNKILNSVNRKLGKI